MSDTTLQERVTKLAEEGFKLLGKTLGQRITLTDASILMDNSHFFTLSYFKYL